MSAPSENKGPSFGLFPDLPAELRLVVWEMALDEHRVFEPVFLRVQPFLEDVQCFRYPHGRPTIYGVCHESMDVANRMGQFRPPTRQQGGALQDDETRCRWFNPKGDIIFLNPDQHYGVINEVPFDLPLVKRTLADPGYAMQAFFVDFLGRYRPRNLAFTESFINCSSFASLLSKVLSPETFIQYKTPGFDPSSISIWAIEPGHFDDTYPRHLFNIPEATRARERKYKCNRMGSITTIIERAQSGRKMTSR